MAANLPFSQYLIKDKARGTLSAGIDASVTTFVFTSGDGAKFPASDFCVKVDTETIYVTTRSSETCSSCTRGYNGTTAAVHAISATVYQAADAALFQRVYDNLEGHDHVKADITDFAHTHAQGDVSNLVTDLAAKAALAGPTFTGVPLAPTAAVGTNTTQLATTAYALAVKLDTLAAPTDITTLNATTSLHGLLRKLDNISTNYLNGQGNWAVPAGSYVHPNHTGNVTSVADGATTIAAGVVTEAMQVLADNTTQDVSITKHGYAPKAPNISTQFLRGDATWAVPAGGSGASLGLVVATAMGLNPS